ncbi:MAG TPA: hypothetical protein VFF11_08055 [Candidatus Binatia bacterium]|nr:hypothetical protein [Candidatus Binatia bacterium]
MMPISMKRMKLLSVAFGAIVIALFPCRAKTFNAPLKTGGSMQSEPAPFPGPIHRTKCMVTCKTKGNKESGHSRLRGSAVE